MKDQYFGDVNDFRKYGLLRSLAIPTGFRLGICWMLTPPDKGLDGRFLSYLDHPGDYRSRDPILYDWLKQVIHEEKDRRTARIETSGLLGNAVFQTKILSDDLALRGGYFSECNEKFRNCELVFLDPDNGLEIRSMPRGRKYSCKFLYWDEVCRFFKNGKSLLIYQHFIREKRDQFTRRMLDELYQRTDAAAVFSFRTPHVLFLLAAQADHVSTFRSRIHKVSFDWAPNQIIAEER